jgi:hypothetical protein
MKNFENGQAHTFHIPVMGLSYTIDTPLRVAHLGISSVISIVDDMLIEHMREFYCRKFDIPFHSISNKMHDFRAKRITAYLNLIDKLVREKFEELKQSIDHSEKEVEKYIALLPEFSTLKHRLQDALKNAHPAQDLKNWLGKNLIPGSIDVNIMTKLDKENYIKSEKQPVEYNDAHAALRGFASSNLKSSIVLSAGMNPRLYAYIEEFDDFYPTAEGQLSKKITLKVSDYRSALIQGKFLAKKGIWISEYRVESGLNCGGHAFATNGMLLGPILQEFKDNREALSSTLHNMLVQALQEKGRPVPDHPLPLKFTVQGGVGTAQEHEFLIEQYEVNSVGWGTPFLLVSEAVNIDEDTQELLVQAREKDLYLSDISPLGVPFNNMRGNTKDLEKARLIEMGKPGSPCPKQYLVSNREFTERPICTASKLYQKLKLQSTRTDADTADEKTVEEITEKACLCVGLASAAQINTDPEKDTLKPGVSVCPGPNMAYFTEKVTLKTMVDHIYGRANVIKRQDRPNLFIKEITLYVDYLKTKIGKLGYSPAEADIKKLQTFRDNLLDGIQYYKNLFAEQARKILNHNIEELQKLKDIEKDIRNLFREEAVH